MGRSMTTFRSEDVLVGLIALGAVPWIGWIILRGMRHGRLPIGRTQVLREERAGAFNALLGFYAVAALGMAVIAVDLIFGLDLRNRA